MFKKRIALGFVICAGLVSQAIAQQPPTPTDAYKIVMMDVGEWNITGKMLLPEGFQEFKGEEKIDAIGKFWTVSHYSSDMFGGLTGSTTIGFDTKTKTFIGTWVDSFQPTVTHLKGTYDQKTKTMTFATAAIGMDGKPMPGKIVIQYKNKNSHLFTMFHKDPTGQTDKMVKTMQMTYTRKDAITRVK